MGDLNGLNRKTGKLYSAYMACMCTCVCKKWHLEDLAVRIEFKEHSVACFREFILLQLYCFSTKYYLFNTNMFRSLAVGNRVNLAPLSEQFCQYKVSLKSSCGTKPYHITRNLNCPYEKVKMETTSLTTLTRTLCSIQGPVIHISVTVSQPLLYSLIPGSGN